MAVDGGIARRRAYGVAGNLAVRLAVNVSSRRMFLRSVSGQDDSRS